MRPISQREARRLRKQVAKLELERKHLFEAWRLDWPGGLHVGSLMTERNEVYGGWRMAQRLGRVILAKMQENGKIDFYAVKQ
jgi:hypothetical protein